MEKTGQAAQKRDRINPSTPVMIINLHGLNDTV